MWQKLWGQSAIFSEENQVCDEEPKNCHVLCASGREGTFYAPPFTQNEFSSSSAMSSNKPFHVLAHKTREQVEQGYSGSLSAENQVSGEEVKDCFEGTCSATPVAQIEKSSSSAAIALQG